jgi:hypothetical protein
MRNIGSATRPVKPLSVHGFFDRVHGWLRFPATRAQQAFLKSHCGSAKFFDHTPCRSNRQLRQRIDLKQPDQYALEWLAAREGAFINIIEIALDLCFANLADRDAVWFYSARHLIRRWHGRTQCIHFYGGDGTPLRWPAISSQCACALP